MVKVGCTKFTRVPAHKRCAKKKKKSKIDKKLGRVIKRRPRKAGLRAMRRMDLKSFKRRGKFRRLRQRRP